MERDHTMTSTDTLISFTPAPLEELQLEHVPRLAPPASAPATFAAWSAPQSVGAEQFRRLAVELSHARAPSARQGAGDQRGAGRGQERQRRQFGLDPGAAGPATGAAAGRRLAPPHAALPHGRAPRRRTGRLAGATADAAGVPGALERPA